MDESLPRSSDTVYTDISDRILDIKTEVIGGDYSFLARFLHS